MAHNRARMPQDESRKTAHIGAKTSPEMARLIDLAAQMRGWSRSRVVEEGAIQRAQQIMQETSERFASFRKQTRVLKAREGGLARHRKK
jgi:uncharacterized protein (DUF1778 family)